MVCLGPHERGHGQGRPMRSGSWPARRQWVAHHRRPRSPRWHWVVPTRFNILGGVQVVCAMACHRLLHGDLQLGCQSRPPFSPASSVIAWAGRRRFWVAGCLGLHRHSAGPWQYATDRQAHRGSNRPCGGASLWHSTTRPPAAIPSPMASTCGSSTAYRSWLIAFLVMATTGSVAASADSSLTNWGGLVLFLEPAGECHRQ